VSKVVSALSAFDHNGERLCQKSAFGLFRLKPAKALKALKALKLVREGGH